MSSYRTVNTSVTAKSLLEVFRPQLSAINLNGTPSAIPPFRNSDNNLTPDLIQSLRGATGPNSVDNSANGAAGTFSNGTKRTLDLGHVLTSAFAYTGYAGTGSVDSSVIVNVYY